MDKQDKLSKIQAGEDSGRTRQTNPRQAGQADRVRDKQKGTGLDRMLDKQTRAQDEQNGM